MFVEVKRKDNRLKKEKVCVLLSCLLWDTREGHKTLSLSPAARSGFRYVQLGL
jgi:hypothetical protein